MYKSNIKQAIQKWNDKNPTLRKKTMKSVAEEIGETPTSLSRIDQGRSSNQFQKHCAVIFSPETKNKVNELFEIYQKADIPVVNKLYKICKNLGCEVHDLVKR